MDLNPLSQLIPIEWKWEDPKESYEPLEVSTKGYTLTRRSKSGKLLLLGKGSLGDGYYSLNCKDGVKLLLNIVRNRTFNSDWLRQIRFTRMYESEFFENVPFQNCYHKMMIYTTSMLLDGPRYLIYCLVDSIYTQYENLLRFLR